jgi:polar amino acid transport system substrate-binding protein
MGYRQQIPLLLLAFLSIPTLATESIIVFAAPTNSSLPTAEFHVDTLTAGMLKDLGQAIGDDLHRKARFVSLPRKRIDAALASGEVDGVCNFRPEWLKASLHWSQPLVTDQELLISSPNVPPPRGLTDVVGKTLSLVLGYKYPELDAVLGKNYQRDDAPNAPLNIEKMLKGRQSYAVVDRLDFNYQSILHPELRSFSALPIATYSLRCGFSPASKIPFSEIGDSIQRLVNGGKVDRILARYR